MVYRLPPQPNLKHLKNQAKELVRDHHNGNLAAAHRIKEHLPRLAHSTPQSILAAEFSLQEAQHVLAREYGFASWKQLLAFIEAKERPRGNPFTQEEIDALLMATRVEEESLAQKEKEEETVLSQETLDTMTADASTAFVDKTEEKTIWDWADDQALKPLSDLHYRPQKLFTSTLTERLGHPVWGNGGTINHEHSFHFIDDYLLPPPQYFFSVYGLPYG